MAVVRNNFRRRHHVPQDLCFSSFSGEVASGDPPADPAPSSRGRGIDSSTLSVTVRRSYMSISTRQHRYMPSQRRGPLPCARP